MSSLKSAWGLLWSPVAASLAAIYLALQGLVAEDKRSGVGIIAAAGFLALSSIVNFAQEQSLSRQMTRVSLRLTKRLTTLVGALGEISGDNYHCWKVDLYTAHWRPGFSRNFPFLAEKRLVKRASMSIVSTVALAESDELLALGPIGRCFAEQRHVMWLSPSSGVTDSLDCYSSIPDALNTQLEQSCGAMRVVPINNDLDADCLGVFAVHVEPAFGPRFAGTMILEECARRLRVAAVELHEIIRS